MDQSSSYCHSGIMLSIVCEADWVSLRVFVWEKHTVTSPSTSNWYLSAPQRYRRSRTWRDNTIWTVSQQCVCELAIDIGRMGHWQDAELRPCPRRLIVRPRIEGAAKEEWLHPSFYFPHLGRPLDDTLTSSGKERGWQWGEGERELEGQRDFKLATKMTASRRSLPPG